MRINTHDVNYRFRRWAQKAQATGNPAYETLADIYRLILNCREWGESCPLRNWRMIRDCVQGYADVPTF